MTPTNMNRGEVTLGFDEKKFERLRIACCEIRDAAKLVRLYQAAVRELGNAQERSTLLRDGIERLAGWEGATQQIAILQRELLKHDPGDLRTLALLVDYYSNENRYAELAKLLEEAMGWAELEGPARLDLHRRLFGLYEGPLPDENQAVSHLAVLLKSSPDPALIRAAERHSASRYALKTLGPILSAIYQRDQRATDEIALLKRELDVSSKERSTEIHWRLSKLHEEVLDDLEGAFEVLEPAVRREPGNDSVRHRFIDLGRRLGRASETGQLLLRALPGLEPSSERARGYFDLARLMMEFSEQTTALQALLEVCRTQSDDPTVLQSARALLGQRENLSDTDVQVVLSAACRLETTEPARLAAAQELLAKLTGHPSELTLRVVALKTLVDLGQDDGALSELAAHCEAERDYLGLAHLRELASQKQEIAGSAQELSFIAAELFTQHGPYNQAKSAWLRHIGRFPTDRSALARLAALQREQGDRAGWQHTVESLTAHLPADLVQALTIAEQEFGLIQTDSDRAWVILCTLRRGWREAPACLTTLSDAVTTLTDENVRGELGQDLAKLLTQLERTEHTIFIALVAGTLCEQAGDHPTVRRVFALFERERGLPPSLLSAVDTLAGLAGADVDERHARLQAALDAAQGSSHEPEILKLLGRFQLEVLCDPIAASTVLSRAATGAPQDADTHRSFLAALDACENEEAALAELERAARELQHEARVEALLTWAQRTRGDRDAVESALSRALQEPHLELVTLEAIYHLAEDEGLYQPAEQALRRIADCTTEPLGRAMAWERLAEYQYHEGELQAAVESWAMAASDVRLDPKRRQGLYSRILEADPAQTKIASSLVHSLVAAGNFDEATVPFEDIAQHHAQLAAELVLDLKETALRDGAAETYVSWIDELVFTADVTEQTSIELLRAKAEAYDHLGRRTPAGDAYRTLVETTGAANDEAEFEAAIERWPLDEETTEHLRWLYERRVERSAAPWAELLQWARAEAHRFGEPETALSLIERALELKPDDSPALTYLAELCLAQGATQRGVEALEALVDACPDQDAELMLRVARLHLHTLGNTEEAAYWVRRILDEAPGTAEAATLALELLPSDAGPSLVAGLSKAARTMSDPAPIFQQLLGATAGDESLASDREEWFRLLIEASPEPEDKLRYTCRAAAELEHSESWFAAAHFWVRETEQPETLLAAYAMAIERATDPEAVATLGKALVTFFDEWFGDPKLLVGPLLRVLSWVPNAKWALDRVALALDIEQRHEILLDLLDHAIRAETDLDAKATLLDEAAVTAKDLARDPDRAIEFLEELLTLRPDDLKTQSRLERLYTQQGHTQKLIFLLSARIDNLAGSAAFDLRLRIAELWLELGDAGQAAHTVLPLVEQELGSPAVLDVLERALTACSSQALPNDARQLDALGSIAACLTKEYQRDARYLDAARVLEVASSAPLDDEARINTLKQLARLRRDELSDPRAAFSVLARLLELVPSDANLTGELHALAEQLGCWADYSVALDEAASCAHALETAARLWFEAASCLTQYCPSPARERELYQKVLDAPVDRSTRRLAARELDRLLQGQQNPGAHANLLVLLAELTDEAGAKTEAWGRAAQLFHEGAGDLERARTCWELCLEQAPEDRGALDGLIAVLHHLSDRPALIDALRQRASSAGYAHARADAVQVARLYAEMGELSCAIEAWQSVEERHGADAESSAALAELLQAAERWSELRVLLTREAREARGAERRLLYTRLGYLTCEHLADPIEALHFFAEGAAWAASRDIVDAADSIRRKSELATLLAELATEYWQRGAERTAEETSYWAAERLVHLALCAPESSQQNPQLQGTKLLALLEDLLSKPFEEQRRRALSRMRARVLAEQLGRVDDALEAYAGLFEQEAADSVADEAFEAWAELLRIQGRQADLAHAQCDRGRALIAKNPRFAAAQLLAAADGFSEMNEHELGRVCLEQAARLNDVQALERLTDLYITEGRSFKAIRVIEQLSHATSGEASAQALQRQSELYMQVGAADRAAMALERACQISGTETRLQRLAELYASLNSPSQRAAALVRCAQRSSDKKAARRLRVEAARLLNESGQPQPVVDLLSPASSDASEVIEYTAALAALGRHEEAIDLLTQRIDSYGGRRTRSRAKLHRALGQVLKALGKPEQALEELGRASTIFPSFPELAFELSQLALSLGELDIAERTLKSLLLVLGRMDPSTEVSRADVYLSLSEVTHRRGDDAQSRDNRDSAFDLALEGPAEVEQLMGALRRSRRHELLPVAFERSLGSLCNSLDILSILASLSRFFARAELGDDIVTRVHQTLAETESALNEDTPQSTWLCVVQVHAWLGHEGEAARARLALASAPPDGLDPVALLENATKLAEGGEPHLAFSLVRQAEKLSRNLLLERGALEAIIAHSSPPPREALVALAETQLLPGDETAHLETLLELVRTEQATASDMELALQAVAEHKLSERAGELLTHLAKALASSHEERQPLWLLAAQVAEQSEDYVTAADYFRRAASLSRGHERLRLLKQSRSLAQSAGARELEFAVLSELVDREPHDMSHALRAAQLAILLERPQDLQNLTARVKNRLASAGEQARFELAIVRAQLATDGNHEDILERLQLLLEQDPSLIEAAELLTAELERRGRLEELVATLTRFSQSVSEQGNREHALQLERRLAHVLERLGRSEEALTCYRKLIREAEEEDLLAEAIALHEQVGADILERTDLLTRMLARSLGSAAARCAEKLADLWEGLGEESEARAALTEGLKRAPDDLELCKRTIDKYLQLGLPEEALALMNSQAAAYLDSAEGPLVKAELLEACERWSAIVPALHTLHFDDPTHIKRALALAQRIRPHLSPRAQQEAIVFTARALVAAERPTEAYEALLLLGEEESQDVSLLRELATVSLQTGNPAWIFKAHRLLLENTPAPDPEDLLRLWNAAANVHEQTWARLPLERALAIHPENAALRAAVSEMYEALGDLPALARHLLAELPNEGEPKARAGALRRIAELEKTFAPELASSHLRQAHELDPTFGSSLLLAASRAAAGNREEALELLSQLTQPKAGRDLGQRSRAFQEIAKIYLATDDIVEAHEALASAFKLDAKNAEVTLPYALSALDLGDEPNARKALRTLITMKPGDADARDSITKASRSLAFFHLGAQALRRGDKSGARSMATRALDEDDRNQPARVLLGALEGKPTEERFA